MIAIIFMTYVVIWSLINRNQMPVLKEEIPFIEKIKKSGKLIPIILLIVSVIGSIYSGVATATEAASLGGSWSINIIFFSKKFNCGLI